MILYFRYYNKLENQILKYILIFVLSIILFGCNNNDSITPCKNDGIDGRVCIEIYQPVCGCDDLTYSNSCYAERDGLTSWTDGECSE